MRCTLILVAFVAYAAAGTAQLRSITRLGDAPKQVALPTANADPKMCPTCINIMIQGLDAFVDAIGNGGVIGGCEDLCGRLPRESEFVVCSALCIYVGVEELVKAINVSDPDPIYVCEEIKVCPISDTAAAAILSEVVAPTTGPLGTNFWINVTFQIINETGTGTIEMWCVPPGTPYDDGLGEEGLLINLPAGMYEANFELPTSDKQVQWPLGTYNSSVWICEGYCDSIHKHQYPLAHVSDLLFTVTKKPE